MMQCTAYRYSLCYDSSICLSVCLVVSFVHCVEMSEWIELVCAMDGIKDDVSRTLVLSGLVSLVLVVFINCCLGHLS